MVIAWTCMEKDLPHFSESGYMTEQDETKGIAQSRV